MANIQPNKYVLQNTAASPFTKVEYETSSFLGQPTLVLTQGSATSPARVFRGSQIRTANTEIGTLVTVTTHMTIDTGSTSFGVLIPAITVTSTSDHKTFTTEAIVTSHTGPNSIPSTGVHETYQFVPLKGEASFVLTAFESVLGPLAKAANK